MSRVGKKPVIIPSGVTVSVEDGLIHVKGPKGELTQATHKDISVRQENGELIFERPSDNKTHRALHGLYRALVQNMVNGVTTGYTRQLDIVGVGYRAELRGKVLQLAIGYSHPIVFMPPAGVALTVPTPTSIVLNGIDKQLIGSVAAKIRSFREPEPYKGKGIQYQGEKIRRKAGKTASR